MLFGKKKNKVDSTEPKKPEIIMYDYREWEEDLGFLTLCISRKTSMIQNYVINIFSQNMSLDKDGGTNKFIHDSDIMDAYEKTVKDVINCLSDNYVAYLVSKYFNGRDELIRFVSESVYVNIVNSAISANKDKINKEYLAEFDKQIQKLNK
jgi:hypothetical protein